MQNRDKQSIWLMLAIVGMFLLFARAQCKINEASRNLPPQQSIGVVPQP